MFPANPDAEEGHNRTMDQGDGKDSCFAGPEESPLRATGDQSRARYFKDSAREGSRKHMPSEEEVAGAGEVGGRGAGKAFKIAVYGAVNALMAIPILFGYAAIIFRHPVFAPYMPALAKLLLFSSMVHQIVFSVVSTLPFAIGQVQDAGLFFLSRMSTDVAKRVLWEGGDAAEAVATALAATALATASLGVALVIAGKAKLARFVAYLPMPVVGGYLAFIGLFCLEAGLGLASGKDIRGINTWGLLLNRRDLLLCLPCVACGVLWSWVSRRYQHFAVLPLTMLAVPAAFFGALALTGESMQSARDYGLIGEVTQPAKLSWSFSLFDWKLVHWSVLPEQLPVWIGMVFVVAFSSSLDVAAIEIDMGEPLDTNKELKTVGWSNILSGLTGGFTGSYIFSQTLFTRRTGCDSRLVGWVVTVSELAMCLVTVDPLAYVPLVFFAATLTFIAVDLTVEWLWEIREKLLRHEYFVLLATFVAIQIVGLNEGLLVGVGFSLVIFVISYASERKNMLERVHKRGRFMRPASQRRLLQVHREKILCVELRGELFFGSSQQVLQQVTAMLGLDHGFGGNGAGGARQGRGGTSGAISGGEKGERTPGEALQFWCWRACKALWKRSNARAKGRTRSPASARMRTRPSRANSLGGDEERTRLSCSISSSFANGTFANGNAYGQSNGSGPTSGGDGFQKPSKSVSFAGDVDEGERLQLGGACGEHTKQGQSVGGLRSSERSPFLRRSPLSSSTSYGANAISPADSASPGIDSTEETDSASTDEEEMPSFIVLDCSKLTNRFTASQGVCVAYAGLTDRMETLLRIHKAIDCENVAIFPSFFAAVDWCETQLIRSVDLKDDDTSSISSFWASSHFHNLTRRESLRSSAVPIKQLLRQVLDLPEAASAVDGVERYSFEQEFKAGEVIFSPGDVADRFYVVTEGKVQMETSLDGTSRPQHVRELEDRQRADSVARAGGQVVFGVGAVFGYVDYHLDERRGHSAIAARDCTVTVFTKHHLDRMLDENPRLLCLVERSVMKHLALELSNLPV